MFRTVINPKQKEELILELPEAYLNKHVEVLAFPVDEDDFVAKRVNFEKALKFFDSHQVDMTNFKFDRDEANAR